MVLDVYSCVKYTIPDIFSLFSCAYREFVMDQDSEHKANLLSSSVVDEGRKRVIGIMAAIMASLHMRTADDLFGGPEGCPRTDKLIAASVQWAE
jgi:hypothetical protein